MSKNQKAYTEIEKIVADLSSSMRDVLAQVEAARRTAQGCESESGVFTGLLRMLEAHEASCRAASSASSDRQVKDSFSEVVSKMDSASRAFLPVPMSEGFSSLAAVKDAASELLKADSAEGLKTKKEEVREMLRPLMTMKSCLQTVIKEVEVAKQKLEKDKEKAKERAEKERQKQEQKQKEKKMKEAEKEGVDKQKSAVGEKPSVELISLLQCATADGAAVERVPVLSLGTQAVIAICS